jgi:hypothetical protein
LDLKDGYWRSNPNPENCRWIGRSIAKNEYHEIDLSELALSDATGIAQLHFGGSCGFHTLHPTQEWRLDSSFT